jgi:steroid delta-isomerase
MLEVLPAAATVRRYYELVDERDFAAVVALFTPDCTYHRPGYDPIVGAAGLRRFFERDRPIVGGQHEVTAVVADGERIAVQGEFRGELRGGERTDLRFADFFELAPDGRFARRDTFFYAPMV